MTDLDRARPACAVLAALLTLTGCGRAATSDTSAPPARPATVAWSTLASPNVDWPHRVGVHVPAGCAEADSCDLLVVFDGPDYVESYGFTTALDSLIAAGRIRPTVAVLVDDSTRAARIGELGNSGRFARFVADDVVPWARAHWRVSRDPHRAALLGSSAGGLAAAYVALERPDVFGNALAQSGAFWRGPEGTNEPPYEYVTSLVAQGPRRDVRFVLDVGTGESHGALGGAAPSILEASRRLRDALRAKGYEVHYTEIPGGVHAPITWAPRLPSVLAALAGPPRPAP